MYFFEWGSWEDSIKTKEQREEEEQIEAKLGMVNKALDVEKAKKEFDENHTKHKFSDTPYSEGPFYAYNNTYLEMRGGFLEERRGVITLISLLYLSGCVFCSTMFFLLLSDLINNFNLIFNGDFLFGFIGFILLTIGVIYFYIKKLWKFTRLELFTFKHIRVRFNRVTRQVYIQRPAYCGGLLVLEWEQMQWPLAYGEEDPNAIGMRNMLAWHPYTTGLPHMILQFVGKRSGKLGDLPNEAEFIRRYMEYGPDELPEPKVSSLFPWPIPCFYPMFEATGKRWALWITILAFPAVAAIGLGYWISQLLCWQPEWPEDIANAGLPGKPRPKNTSLEDYPEDIQEKLLLNADRWLEITENGKILKAG